MTWLEAQPIKVIHRRENGSGVVEIPIMVPSQNGEIDLGMMRDVAANFDAFPVVPVSVSPHREFEDRGGFSPAFVESVELRDATLYGRLDLIAPLFHEVVEQGGWRGFSVEIHKDLKTQAKELSGWTLTGGIFTNRPAVDAHFKIAAEGGEVKYSFSICPSTGEEKIMPEQKPAPAEGASKQLAAMTENLSAVNAEKKALEGRVGNLSDELREAKQGGERHAVALEAAKNDLAAAEAKVNRLEAEQRGVKEANSQLTATVTDLTEKLDKERGVNLSTKVLAIRDSAVANGVPPAVFDGIDADPAAWMASKYASVEAFHDQMKTLSGVSRDLVTVPPKSAKDRQGSAAPVDDETKKRLRRMGLDAKYVGIKSEGELRDLQDAEKEK